MMMTRLVAAFSLFIALIATASPSVGEQVGYTIIPHPIYAQSDNKSEIIGTVRVHDVMVFVRGGNCAAYFCQIWYPYLNKLGFINAPFTTKPPDTIFPPEPAEGYAAVTRELNLRAAPMEATTHLGIIYPGGRVKKERCEAAYCYVTTARGYQGWALKAGLEDEKVLRINENIKRLPGFEVPNHILVSPLPRP